jgi:hypothetical protein
MKTTEHLQYIAVTLCWMGGDRVWSEEMVAEQLGLEDSQRFWADLAAACDAGILSREPSGVKLTDVGWDLAASDSNEA